MYLNNISWNKSSSEIHRSGTIFTITVYLIFVPIQIFCPSVILYGISSLWSGHHFLEGCHIVDSTLLYIILCTTQFFLLNIAKNFTVAFSTYSVRKPSHTWQSESASLLDSMFFNVASVKSKTPPVTLLGKSFWGYKCVFVGNKTKSAEQLILNWSILCCINPHTIN